MKLLVGLGNPGKKYENTRHNAGFRLIDRLASSHEIRIRKKLFSSAVIGRGLICANEVILAKPVTYMNLSGAAVAKIMRDSGISCGELVVITDDFSLDFGVIRIRAKGSAGGHNGLASVINAVGADSFARLRIGIGKIPDTFRDAAEYVLSAFSASEEKSLEDVLSRGAAACEDILCRGVEYSMNKYNG